MHPTTTRDGLTFFPMQKFRKVYYDHGAPERLFLKNDVDDLPDEHRSKANDLYFFGGALPDFGDEVDRKHAFRTVKCWLMSLHVPHETKVMTIGYAFWVWSPEECEWRRKNNVV